jgi:hypothetical protein
MAIKDLEKFSEIDVTPLALGHIVTASTATDDHTTGRRMRDRI